MAKIQLFQPGDEWQEKAEGRTPTSDTTFTLSDLAEEWRFFNHGALFSFAEFEYPSQDPVGDWYAKQEVGTEVLLQPFKNKVFDGISGPIHLGDLRWDNVVCAVREEKWQGLFEYLGGVCSVNRKDRTFFRVFAGELDILDPVLAERHSVFETEIPTVKVTVFCIDGNKSRWEIRPPRTIAAPPRMVIMPPRDEVVALAEAVFRGEMDKLQTHQNPAFQPHLDAYKSIVLGGEHERPSGATKPRRGEDHPGR